MEVFSFRMRFFLSDWMRLPPRVLPMQLQIIKIATIEGIVEKIVAVSDARAWPDYGMPPSERQVFFSHGPGRRILKQIPALGFRLFRAALWRTGAQKMYCEAMSRNARSHGRTVHPNG
jgi:hypothetical protein